MDSTLAPFLTKNDHKKSIISNWFLVLKWSPPSPELIQESTFMVGGSHEGCAADRSVATVWCKHLNMEQNLCWMFSAPCWIYAVVWREKRVQPSTSKLYLIKWPIRVSYCTFFIYIFLHSVVLELPFSSASHTASIPCFLCPLKWFV